MVQPGTATDTMLDPFLKAFAQFDDPALRGVMWRVLGFGVLAALGLAIAGGFLLAQLTSLGGGWIEAALEALGGLAVFVLVLLFFPALAGLIASLYLEQIARAVELRHYPQAPPPRVQPATETLVVGLRFLLALVGLNILALPLYFVPVVNLAAFALVNGSLLGREYFEFAALRYLTPGEARALRRANRGRALFGGIVLALIAGVPLLNLLLPIIGTAAFVHIVARLRLAKARAG